ncbi:hypothetical protein NXK88_002780 [Enterococcus hirae]|nr:MULTISPECIES: hypothetical protein [Enterococcus]EMF0203497.1 hypothetical protein [Enterococcus hirae]
MDDENRSVRPGVSIPFWLKELADEEGLSYSSVLQKALIDILKEKGKI